MAATTNGLYERVPSGGFTWQQRRTGVHTSVIVTSSGGTTRWFAARNADLVYTSTDGNTWTAVGTGFPASIARIALGAQPDNPNVLYAVIVNTAGGLHSVRRLDGVAGPWKNVSGTPALLPASRATTTSVSPSIPTTRTASTSAVTTSTPSRTGLDLALCGVAERRGLLDGRHQHRPERPRGRARVGARARRFEHASPARTAGCS